MTLTAIIDGDLVIGRMTGIDDGPPIPSDLAALPDTALRFDGSAIIDVRSHQNWHIDDLGEKHLGAASGRQPLTCAWDDKVVKSGSVWRVQTAADVMAPLVKAECKRRIFAVASQNTQTNLAARQSRLTGEDAAVYSAGLDWIDAMRARCTQLIASQDGEFRQDAKWPAAPAGLAELCARF